MKLLSILLLVLPFVGFCTKHQLSQLKTTINIIESTKFDYQPGDTFCIPSNEIIGGLRFNNFSGSADKPLVFINEGGRVIIEEPTYSGITFNNCTYIHLTGTGSSDEYGIHVRKTKSGTVGVAVSSLSSDVEIDHIEISNTGFAGIMAKTDPSCDKPETWRRNGYVLKNLDVHDNYIHHTGGEGMYIGYTGGYMVESKKICNDEYVFGHWLENVNIHHNKLEQTGWDGIQVNLVRKNCTIHHNTIVGYGVDQEKYQNFGFSLGGGNIQLYNNYVENIPENLIDGSMGMQMIGASSGSYIVGNVFKNTAGYGIFIHNRYEFETSEGYYIAHNTVVNAGHSSTDPRSAIMYNACITLSEDAAMVGSCQEDVNTYFYNNLVVNPGADYESKNFWKKEPECYIDFNTKALRDSALSNMGGNIYTRNSDTLLVSSNYKIVSAQSVLYNKGVDVSQLPIPLTDIAGVVRPAEGLFDVGAYEFVEGMTNVPLSANIITYPNPAQEYVMVEGVLSASQIAVYNSFGDDITKNVLIDIDGSTGTIHFNHCASGIYFLKIGNSYSTVAIQK